LLLFWRIASVGLLFALLGAGCGDAAGEVQGPGLGGTGGQAGSGGGAGPGTASFSVTLIDETELLSDRLVMYADADGKHVATTLSSQGGVARFTNVPAGGFVTAQLANTTELLSLQTVAGVQDGDAITLVAADAFGVPSTWSLGRAAITVSSLPESAKQYLLYHPGHLTGVLTEVPFTSEVSFSTHTIGPSGTYNALAVAELEDRSVAFGFVTDVALEGLIPNASVAGTIDSWAAPTGTVRAELRNVSKVHLPVVILLGGYRDAQRFLTEAGSESLPSGATLNTELQVSSDFHDRAVATFVLDVFGNPIALANERFVASTAIPDDGDTEVIWTSTDDFLPSLVVASHDFAERSSAYDWTRTPLCDGVPPNVSLLELVGKRESTSYSWKMLGPYHDELRMPELDPAYAEVLFPSDLEEDQWTLEARAYPEGSFDSVRLANPALLPPLTWLGHQTGAEAVCVSRARTGAPR
jgi:hypothetical protein